MSTYIINLYDPNDRRTGSHPLPEGTEEAGALVYAEKFCEAMGELCSAQVVEHLEHGGQRWIAACHRIDGKIVEHTDDIAEELRARRDAFREEKRLADQAAENLAREKLNEKIRAELDEKIEAQKLEAEARKAGAFERQMKLEAAEREALEKEIERLRQEGKPE